jgi:putative transposase
MGTYRTLVLGHDLHRLPPGVVEKVPLLLGVHEEFCRWATEWAKSGGSLPPPRHNPLKHFAERFLYAGRMMSWLKRSGAEAKKLRPPLFFNTQLRLEREHDRGSEVFVDLPKREVRIRKLSSQRGNTIALPLSEGAVRWILERTKEGAKLVLAAVWVGRSKRNHAVKLYVALVFRREVAPMEVKRLLVVDLNALHNGVAWAVVEGERVVAKGVLRPDVSKVLRIQKVAARLDSLCSREERACDEATATRSRIWRLMRNWEEKAVKKLVQLAIQYKTAVVVDVPYDESIRTLKESRYVAERKVFLNFGRFRRRLKGLAEWYGVPYREERLYSTVCPRCGERMGVLPDRRVKCVCGFEAHRDEVPIFWAMRRFHELTSSFSGSSLSGPSPS